MAFSATLVQPVVKASTPASIGSDIAPSILSMLIVSVYAAKKSSKAMRKMQRQLAWNTLKHKATTLFSKRAEGVSDRTLLYILLGVIFLVVLAISPITALALAVVALILYLAGVIKI